MMPDDAFRLPWKFLAQLFSELGGIPKILVVDVDVLRDYRLPADTICRLSPAHARLVNAIIFVTGSARKAEPPMPAAESASETARCIVRSPR